ncbi:uncharacterized protein LOC124145493 [Haliotis rufescens]|uniref:uncharacterized protein LOC124145493 n=1 Tax=Haliotis rufescens TaxID=6454 RepID=UPI00201F539F|nr:uncharacterized protein LOC124145493 [Haliotis rufescens]
MKMLGYLLLTCTWCVVASSNHCIISSMIVEANGNTCDVMNRPISYQSEYEVEACGVTLTCIDGGINACTSQALLCTVITTNCNVLVRETTQRVDRLICKE